MRSIVEKTKQIENMIRKTVIESLQGVLTDPDFGLELRDGIKRRLKKYRIRTPKKMSSLDEIKKKYL